MRVYTEKRSASVGNSPAGTLQHYSAAGSRKVDIYFDVLKSMHMKKILGTFFVLLLASPVLTSAQIITTPYWCGWGWSSSPCTSYYGQTYNYSYTYPTYSYGYTYNNPCIPVSYDSRGVVVQTSCGYTPNYSYYQNHQWYQPNYQYYYQPQWRDYDYDHSYDRDYWSRDRDHDHRDRNWDHH